MPAAGTPRFSILTCAFDTAPGILRETGASVFGQRDADFEWVLLDNGSSRADTRAVLAEFARDPRVHLLRLEHGLGILGGLHHAFAQARGEYVLVLDHDDLLTPDALAKVAARARERGEPDAIYSDESVVEGTKTIAEYRRPEWDPILNLASSYVFHLLAFRRDLGARIGVFADRAAEFCQDWDTVWRLASAGAKFEHVPEVLYHWRRHKSSATNRATPDSGSLRSQRAILERVVAAHPCGSSFAVVPCAIDRGAPELHVARLPTNAAPVDLVFGVLADSPPVDVQGLTAAWGYPFRSVQVVRLDAGAGMLRVAADGYVCLLSEVVTPVGRAWPWEALGMLEWHAEAAVVAPRLLDRNGKVLAGPDDRDARGKLVCRHAGRAADDSGPWGLATKAQSAGALHPAFWFARAAAVRAACEAAGGLPLAELGTRLGALARERGERIAFSPFVVGRMRGRA